MIWIVILVGISIAGIGVFGLARPAEMIAFVESTWKSPAGFPIAVGSRVVFGIALLMAAPDCRHPQVVQVIGVIALVAAVAAVLIGRERLTAFVTWFSGLPIGAVRAWALIAVAFGGFLIYTAS